MKIVTVIRFVL